MRLGVASFCLMSLLAAPAWGQADFIDPAPLSQAGLTKFWQLQLPLDTGRTIADAFLVDDQIYLATDDGFVFAVHADTGAIRWLRPVTRSGYRLRRPAHIGERTVFVNPTEVVEFDKRSGDPIKQMELRTPASSGAATDGTRLFLGSMNGRVFAFNPETLFVDWKFVTGSSVVSTPAVFGTTEKELFVASSDGGVFACRSANKRYLWQARTAGDVTADVVVDDNGVYVACQDQSLYLFDLTFGQLRWRMLLSGALSEAPVTTPELAYQYCPDDGVVAINTAVVQEGDRKRWALRNGRSLLTVDSKNSYILTADQKIAVVETRSGTVLHEIVAPGFTFPLPSPASNTLFAASADGRVFCARPTGVPFVRLADVRAALLPPPDATEQPSTQPARPVGDDEDEDFLESQRRGAPVGGKSKVTKDYKEGAQEAGKDASKDKPK